MGWAVEILYEYKAIRKSVISVCHYKNKSHILLIEQPTRTHSYFISSILCDTFIQI